MRTGVAFANKSCPDSTRGRLPNASSPRAGSDALSHTWAVAGRGSSASSKTRISLDNNATERALRGPVVGRKNHYASRSRRGTEVAALFYTLCETSMLLDVDPRRYLRIAVAAALDGVRVPLPYELKAVGPSVPASG